MSLGLGEFLSLLCALLWAFAVICYRKAGEKIDVSAMNLFKISLTLILMIPTLYFTDGLIPPSLSTADWLLLLVSGFFGIMLADLFYLRALQLIGAGLTGLTGSLYSPFVVFLSFFYLGERLNSWQIMGMALVIIGVLVISYRKKSMTIEHPPIRGFIYAALGVFFTALGIVIIKPVTTEMPFFWIITIRTLGGISTMVIFNLLLKKSLNPLAVMHSSGKYWLLAGALLGQYLSTMIWVAGYKYTSASVASILNETASIFILILGWLMLKEQLTTRKLVGAFISVSGVLLVIQMSQ
ncbi:DMT family transporter [Marinicella sp. S1101]|uniref:DMT family transporter n=1 Tax=Marinicella marina TaxID=2996016 RepID=UPI002260E720|nr:DMT family transporter [Marinicella marina]MCX7553732.1 DMT family transporter [Marinicella marina]MDJ1140807.1 DMT family transporter [Marinicella marina]